MEAEQDGRWGGAETGGGRLSAAGVRSATGSIREQLLVGALRQGPSFVVLLLLLFGIWKTGNYVITEGIAHGIEQIKAGYREIQAAHDKNLSDIISAFERENQREETMVRLIREVVENRDLLREAHEAILGMRAGLMEREQTTKETAR